MAAQPCLAPWGTSCFSVAICIIFLGYREYCMQDNASIAFKIVSSRLAICRRDCKIPALSTRGEELQERPATPLYCGGHVTEGDEFRTRRVPSPLTRRCHLDDSCCSLGMNFDYPLILWISLCASPVTCQNQGSCSQCLIFKLSLPQRQHADLARLLEDRPDPNPSYQGVTTSMIATVDN